MEKTLIISTENLTLSEMYILMSLRGKFTYEEHMSLKKAIKAAEGQQAEMQIAFNHQQGISRPVLKLDEEF